MKVPDLLLPSLYLEAGEFLLALLESLAEVLALHPVPLHAARQLLVAVADLVGKALRRAAPDRTAARFSGESGTFGQIR